MTAYPRDMVGYGQHMPHARWPNNARVAVQFVVNYEEGGENNILHGDAASEAFLSEIVGAQPWPGMRHANMESIYEYGSRAGFWRLHRMFTARNMPVTCFGVATAMARHPEIVTAMRSAGWEIATHGLKWIDYRDHAPEDERKHIDDAVRIHMELCGERPLGMYQGRSSINTIRLTMEEGGFLYSADTYADDLPYYIEGPNGRGGNGPFLIVPYTLDANDMRFATPQGFNTGEHFYSYLKDAFDALYAEGETQPKMMSVGLHCRLVGRPGRAAALARFLDYVQGHADAWVATRLDIARHWVMHHAPKGGWKPSTMPKPLFMQKFGGIFEHSAWVAEAAFASGIDPECDSAEGLHAAMVKAMLAGGHDRQKALLNAHPDLAGKLHAAKQLTPESTEEQAGAGLDSLTDVERVHFTTLNDSYKAKFGIPYILAVKGKTKPEIVDNFEQRLNNTAEQEFDEALRQVQRITLLRLKDVPGLGGAA